MKRKTFSRQEKTCSLPLRKRSAHREGGRTPRSNATWGDRKEQSSLIRTCDGAGESPPFLSSKGEAEEVKTGTGSRIPRKLQVAENVTTLWPGENRDETVTDRRTETGGIKKQRDRRCVQKSGSVQRGPK